MKRILFFLILLILTIIKTYYLNWYVSNNAYFKALMWDSSEYDSMAMDFINNSFWKGNLFILPPGYPLFLSLIYKIFGHSYFFVLLIQNILTILSLIFLYLLSKNLFNERIAICTIFLYGFYGVSHFYDNKLMDNSLVNFLLIFFAYFAVRRIVLKKSNINLFVSGLCLAFASLAKPNFLILAFLFLILLVYEYRKKFLLPFLYFLFSIIIMISPIAIRNYLISKDLILISPYGGLAFYGGNRANAKPYFEGLPLSIEVKPIYNVIAKFTEDETNKKMTPSEISSYYYKKALNFIIHNPFYWLNLLKKKIILSFGSYEQEANYSYDLEINPYKKFFFIPFALIISLGILGFIIEKLNKGKLLILLIIITVYATLWGLYMIPRLRFPAVPFLCIFASLAINRIIDLNSMKSKILFYISFLFLFFFSLRIMPPYPYNLQANEYIQYGLAYLKINEFSKAEYYLKKAIEIEPNYSRGYLSLGLLYKKMGQDQKALDYYKLALKYNDADAEIHSNLASLYFANNNLEKAEFHLTRAYQLNPYHPIILYNMALLKYKLNKIQEAKYFYSEAIKLGFGNIR